MARTSSTLLSTPATLFIPHPLRVINRSPWKYVMIAHKKECHCRHPYVLCFILLQQTIRRNRLLHACLEWYPTPRNIRCCSLLVATPYIACTALWIVSLPWGIIVPLQCCCCYVAFVLHLYHTLKGVVPTWNNCGMNGGLLEEREWLREGTLVICNVKIRLFFKLRLKSVFIVQKLRLKSVLIVQKVRLKSVMIGFSWKWKGELCPWQVGAIGISAGRLK